MDCCGLLFIQATLQENLKKETDGIANSLATRCYTEIKLIKPSPTQCVMETLLKQPDDRFVTTAISFLKCVLLLTN